MTDTSNQSPQQNSAPEKEFAFFSFLITFVLMLVTWVVLSGKFDTLLLSLGVISSGIVAWFFHDLLFPGVTGSHIRIFLRFSVYIPWLILEIIKANFHLLKIVFHPRMADLIDPHVTTFKTDLKSDLAIATLANSITLTPGTITVTASSEGVFRVHAIDKPSADALPGTMLEKVADIFGEEK